MPEWLTIFLSLGGSSLIACIVTTIFNSIVNGAKARKRTSEAVADEMDRRNEILKKGIQALLRHDLNEIYNEWYPKGYCPDDVKIDFQNMYEQYHSLGKNGVMGGKYNAIINLPSTSREKERLVEDK